MSIDNITNSFAGVGIQQNNGSIYVEGNLNIGSRDSLDDRCLADLRLTDPRQDKKRIEDSKGGLFHDVYAWILYNNDFLQWRDDTDTRMLWIRGNPGKGKTMLVCGLIDELIKAQPKTLIAYFFCQATDSHLNNATAVLRGLIYSIVLQRRALIKHVTSRYHEGGKRIFEDVNAWITLSEILKDLLQDSRLVSSPVILVIDALDECQAQLPHLLGLITRTLNASSVKWLVSSRNLPRVEGLSQASHRVRLCLELNERSIAEAVQKYIQIKTRYLAKKKQYTKDLLKTVREYLLSNSNDTFLWVALVCDQLEKPEVTRRSTRGRLECLPPSLDALYMRMLEELRHSDEERVCISILRVVLVTYRPLALVELQGLISQDVEISEYYGDFETTTDLEETLSHCGSFLTVQGGGVYFIHQSAKDFLLNMVSGPILPSGLGGQHRILFSQSIRLLHKNLSRNPFSLKTLEPFAKGAVKEDCTPFINVGYSCLYWADHLADCLRHGSNFRHSETLKVFLEHKFLNWLEALGYISGVNHGIESLLKVENYLERQGTAIHKDVVALVHDASRFIRFVKGAIDYNPLQVYATGLFFSPDTSIIRQLYEGLEQQPWATSWSRHGTSWDGRLLTLPRKYTSSQGREWLYPHGQALAIAPDGTRLASSFSEYTASVHDMTAGAYLQSITFRDEARAEFRDRNYICSMAFSPPDGLQIAIGYSSGTVAIWDLTTSRCTHELRCPELVGRITALLFDPRDSNRLIAASWTGDIVVWRVETCECMQHLKHSVARFAPVSLTFEASNDNAMALVSVSVSGGKVWDLNRGECIRTMDSWPLHLASGQKAPFSFTECGSKLMVASQHQLTSKPTLFFWDIPTGKVSHQDCLGSETISAAAFVPGNSRQVVIGSYHIKIRDTWTGTWLHTIESGFCQALAFTPSALKLVSASAAGGIKIWDWTLLASPAVQEGHNSQVYSLELSPSGRHLACCLERHGQHFSEIWDTVDEKCLYTIRHKNGHRNSSMPCRGGPIVFSPDSSRMLLSTSPSSTSILKIETGERLGRLKYLENYFDSAVFSRDGDKLATSTNTPRHPQIEIWDGITGSSMAKFKYHVTPSYRSNMVFSLDGQLLAYCCAAELDPNTFSLQVRNTTTGLLLHDIPWNCHVCAHSNAMMSFNSDGTGLVVATMESFSPEISEIRELDLKLAKSVMMRRRQIPHVVVELSQDGRFARFEKDDCSGVLDIRTGQTLSTDEIAALDGESGFASRLGLQLETGYLTQNCRPILWLPPTLRELNEDIVASASDTIAFATSDSNFAVIRVPS